MDRFAQIAFGGYLNNKDELQETKPILYPYKNIAKSTNEAPVIKENDYQQNVAQFREDIKKLKNKYSPFMKDYSPEITMTRKAWVQDEFQFRYETALDQKDINVVLAPIRINLRTDQFRGYAGETGSVETWILNDTPCQLEGLTMRITLRDVNNTTYDSFEAQANARSVSPNYGGTLQFTLLDLGQRGEVYLDAVLLDQKGQVINQERLRLEVFKREDKLADTNVMYVGDENNAVIKGLGLTVISFNPNAQRPEVVLVDSQTAFKKEENIILAWVKEGTKMVLLDEVSEAIEIGEIKIPIKQMNGLTFLARNANHEATKGFYPKDFSYPYNKHTDEIDFFSTRFMDSDKVETLVYTYQKPAFFESARGEKKKLSAAGCIAYGKGCIYVSLLDTDGFIGCNPALDQFYLNLLS